MADETCVPLLGRLDVLENGFLLIDFAPETITLRYLKSNKKTAHERHRHARTVSYDRVEGQLATLQYRSPGHPLATDLIASGGLHVARIKRQFKRNPAAEAVAQMLRRRRDASGIQREIAQRFS